MRTRANVVIDASCVLRAVLDARTEALSWLESIEGGVVNASAPDLLYAEVANALVRRRRSRQFCGGRLLELLDMVTALPVQAVSSRLLAAAAYGIALERGVTAYDAHYVALAEAERAVLVTADHTLAAAVTKSVLLE